METTAEPTASPARKLRGTFLDRLPSTESAPPTPAAPSTTPVVPYAPAARPLRAPINLRMILFGALVLGLLGWPIYTLVHEVVTHGISNHGDRIAVDLKAMGNFNMPDGGTLNDVPSEFRALDGKRVELEGYMYAPRDASDHATEFEFVYNVAKCCFGGPPKVQERVYGIVPSNRNVDVYDQYTPARIIGVLHVKVVKSMGRVVSVYTLDVEHSEKMG